MTTKLITIAAAGSAVAGLVLAIVGHQQDLLMRFLFGFPIALSLYRVIRKKPWWDHP